MKENCISSCVADTKISTFPDIFQNIRWQLGIVGESLKKQRCMYRKSQRTREAPLSVFALPIFIAQLPPPNISRCVPVRSPEHPEVQAKSQERLYFIPPDKFRSLTKPTIPRAIVSAQQHKRPATTTIKKHFEKRKKKTSRIVFLRRYFHNYGYNHNK